MRTRTPADMDRSKPGWKNVLNPNIMMMGCGFLINWNIIFWEIFQNICWSFCHWKRWLSTLKIQKVSRNIFNDIPFVNNPSSASVHLNNWAFFFNDSFIRVTRTVSSVERYGKIMCSGIPAYVDIYHSIFYIEPTFLSTICLLDFLAQDNSGLTGLSDGLSYGWICERYESFIMSNDRWEVLSWRLSAEVEFDL